MAKEGFKVELIKQKSIKVDGVKKQLKTHDAFVNGEKWEFKYTKDYENLSKSIGTKAGTAVLQKAEVVLIDISKTEKYSIDAVISGVKNSFYYNPDLKKICVMIESDRFVIIERTKYVNGAYIAELNDFL